MTAIITGILNGVKTNALRTGLSLEVKALDSKSFDDLKQLESLEGAKVQITIYRTQ